MCLLWKNEFQRLCIDNDCSPCNALQPHLSGEINTIKIISHNDNHHHHPREHKSTTFYKRKSLLEVWKNR